MIKIDICLEEHSKNKSTVKPLHEVTSVKQSPALKITFFCPVIEYCICIELLLRGHLSYKLTFSLSQR